MNQYKFLITKKTTWTWKERKGLVASRKSTVCWALPDMCTTRSLTGSQWGWLEKPLEEPLSSIAGTWRNWLYLTLNTHLPWSGGSTPQHVLKRNTAREQENSQQPYLPKPQAGHNTNTYKHQTQKSTHDSTYVKFRNKWNIWVMRGQEGDPWGSSELLALWSCSVSSLVFAMCVCVHPMKVQWPTHLAGVYFSVYGTTLSSEKEWTIELNNQRDGKGVMLSVKAISKGDPQHDPIYKTFWNDKIRDGWGSARARDGEDREVWTVKGWHQGSLW